MQLVPKNYTVTEISKTLEVPPTTIRTWEKSLEGVLNIPRDSKGNRYYTDYELDLLRTVKAMRDIGLGFDYIRENLHTTDSKDLAPIEPKDTSILPNQFIEELTAIIRNQVTNELKGEMDNLKQELESMRKEVAVNSEAMSNQMKSISEQVQIVITETRAERHKKKGLWSKLFGK